MMGEVELMQVMSDGRRPAMRCEYRYEDVMQCKLDGSEYG